MTGFYFVIIDNNFTIFYVSHSSGRASNPVRKVSRATIKRKKIDTEHMFVSSKKWIFFKERKLR